MSIASILDVADADSATLRNARDRWTAWTSRHPGLNVVDDLRDLPRWNRKHGSAADAVLRALAEIGSPDGDDEALAVSVLSWLLVPGAVRIGYSHFDTSDVIDERVASHLWTSARTFDCQKPSKVAPTILRATRRGVQADVGVGEGALRSDRTWSQTTPVADDAETWHALDATPNGPSAAEELLDLFNAAEADGVLLRSDRDLLIDLAMVWYELSEAGAAPRHLSRKRGGLTSGPVLQEVATRHRATPDRVRGRATRSLRRLGDYSAKNLDLLCA